MVDLSNAIWLEKKGFGGRYYGKDATELKISISYTRKKQVRGVLLSFSEEIDKKHFINYDSIRFAFMPKRLYLVPTKGDAVGCYKINRARHNTRPTIFISQLKMFEQFLGSHTLSVEKDTNGNVVYYVNSIK